MTAAVYIASCAAFIIAAMVTGMIALARRQMAQIAETTRALADKDLSDEDKERIARQGAMLALTAFLKLMVAILIVVVATMAPAVIAERLGWTTADAVWNFALRIDVLVLTVLMAGAAVFLVRRTRRA